MKPSQLSHELRKSDHPDMVRRRWIVGLSMLGAGMGQLVSLYQTGIIDHLPDPPIGIFDADRVDASDYAYSRLNAPDGPMMITNYAITAWLASTGGKNRAQESPFLPLLMAGKLLLDVLVSAELAREEWRENQALCEYCQIATLASIASVVIAVPEVLCAINSLLGQSQSQVSR